MTDKDPECCQANAMFANDVTEMPMVTAHQQPFGAAACQHCPICLSHGSNKFTGFLMPPTLDRGHHAFLALFTSFVSVEVAAFSLGALCQEWFVVIAEFKSSLEARGPLSVDSR